MADAPVETGSKIEAGVKAAEGADAAALAHILNAENIYDRAGLAKNIQQAVDHDRVSNASLPTLELSTRADQAGKDVLVDITSGAKNGSSGDHKILYHADFSEGTFSRDNSFQHPKQSVYDTIDPTSGKIIAEDVMLAGGRSAHNTADYDATTGKMTAKNWTWSDGETEHYTYDKEGREATRDDAWKADGKLRTVHTENKYDATAKYLAATSKTFSDGNKLDTCLDAQGRILTQDSVQDGGKQFHYSAKYNAQTDKLEYEKSLSTDSSDVKTYDPKSGKILTQNQAYSWGSISEEHKYDPLTNNEIYYHRHSSSGSDEVQIHDNDGKFVSLVEKREDGKVFHKEATYQGKDLLTADETWYDNSGKHLENQYDQTSSHLAKQTVESHTADGKKSSEVDAYDPASGKLKSEDMVDVDGNVKHIGYDRIDNAVGGKKGDHVLNVSEIDSKPDGTSQEHKYVYNYNDAVPDHPKGTLKLQWNAVDKDGNLSPEDERRVSQMQYIHLPKASGLH